MKKTAFVGFCALCAAALVLSACQIEPDEEEKGQIPEKYKEFYNYPDGRVNPSGTLEIRNTNNSPALLFIQDVAGENYVGTVPKLGSVHVKLPEDKFYTILAVDKENYEEKGAQATYFSDMVYYNGKQPYSMAVNAENTFGAGKWIITNNTSYWVSFRKSDQSGHTYAVVPPNATRVTIPVPFDVTYDYIPHFYKELKSNGKVIAIVESDVPSGRDIMMTRESIPTFNTTIGIDITPPSANLKPAVYAANSSGRSVRVYSGQNKQLGSTGMGDFALISGDKQLFTEGFDMGDSVGSINFELPDGTRKYVTSDLVMQKDKVYYVQITGTAPNYTTSVQEQDAGEYFN